MGLHRNNWKWTGLMQLGKILLHLTLKSKDSSHDMKKHQHFRGQKWDQSLPGYQSLFLDNTFFSTSLAEIGSVAHDHMKETVDTRRVCSAKHRHTIYHFFFQSSHKDWLHQNHSVLYQIDSGVRHLFWSAFSSSCPIMLDRDLHVIASFHFI